MLSVRTITICTNVFLVLAVLVARPVLEHGYGKWKRVEISRQEATSR